MLYLLGGAPRTGKSIIARKFVAEKQIPFFSIDALTTILEESLPNLGIKHGQPFISKAENLWPALKSLLVHLIEEEPDYLIEGDAFLPKHIPELEKKYKNEVKVCFTGFTKISPQDKLREIRKFSGYKDDWTKGRSDERMLKAIKSMIEFSQYLKKESKKFNIKYFEISDNFQKNLDIVFEYLSSG